MKPEAVRMICDEHLAISAVLFALRQHVRRVAQGEPADFPFLKAIIDYVVSYPDRWHHPKEDEVLFVAIRRRTDEADGLIARLEREHRLGRPMMEELARLLAEYQRGDDAAGSSFCALAERYADLEWAHLNTEEESLLPIAERVLSADDWEEVAEAFRSNDDPLFGIKPRDEARTLYQRVLALAPTTYRAG